MIHALVVILLVAGVIIVGYIVFSSLTGRRSPRSYLDTDYVLALEALINSDEEEAIGHLIEAAKKDPSSIHPFLVLGDVFRKRGELQKARKIHHELSIRPNVDKEGLAQVFKSLSLDYLELNDFEAVVQSARMLLSLKKKDLFALDTLLRAYEGLCDWDEAIGTARTISNCRDDLGPGFLARYHAYVGSRVVEEDPLRAEGLFRKALSLDPRCVPAGVYLGDIYFKDGRYDRAIELWGEMLDRDSEAIRHVAGRLERAYFESGKYSLMMDVYERLHKRIPRDVTVLLGMAKMSLKKGDFSSAVRYVDEAREINPEDQRIYQAYLEIEEESGDIKRAVEACRDYFNRRASEYKGYACRSCGHESESFILRCPVCGRWIVDSEMKAP